MAPQRGDTGGVGLVICSSGIPVQAPYAPCAPQVGISSAHHRSLGTRRELQGFSCLNLKCSRTSLLPHPAGQPTKASPDSRGE